MKDKKYNKSQEKSHNKYRGKSENKSQEKSHNKYRGKSENKSQEKSHSKYRGKSENKSQEKSHSKYRGKSENKSQEKSHNKYRGKSENKSQEKSHSKYRGKSENKSQEKSHNKYRGKSENKFQDRHQAKNKSKSYKKTYQQEEPVRLNRFISRSGVCSRRQADELIRKGLIKVNGKVVTELSTKVNRDDKITYKNRTLRGEKNIYLLLNKPKDYITTVKDTHERKTVMDFFDGRIKERIYPVGRLDRNTSGVLLFTNDGDLTTKLTHPKSKVKKKYVVTLDRFVIQNDMYKIAEGIELEDGFISADAIYYYNEKDKNKVIVELHSGRNRIIRRIFEHLEYKIKNLDRIEFAGLNKKDLKRGQWRHLETKEIGFLKMLAGKTKKK